jgi:alpha-beta hydrolase superfamily lysophospholipase
MSEAKKIYVLDKKNRPQYGLTWKIENPKANVIIMTGMEEHSSRYDEFAKFLNDNGFNVYCIDAFGQGENVYPDESNKGIWPKSGFRKQVYAVDNLIKELRITCKPAFIFSHSMGSFMCQDYIQRYTHHVSKVVLCGTGAKNPVAPIGYQLARLVTFFRGRETKAGLLNKLMFSNFNKGIANPRTPYDWLSYNTENVDKYIADPLCGFGPNNGFCLEFLKGLKRLHRRKFLLKIRKDLDIFIISGKDDPVSNYGKDVNKLKTMYNKLGINNVSTKVYENMRHEILNENDCQIVYEDVLKFFEK